MNTAFSATPDIRVLIIGAGDAVDRIRAFRLEPGICTDVLASVDSAPTGGIDAIVLPVDDNTREPLEQVKQLVARYPGKPLILILEMTTLDFARAGMQAGASDTTVRVLLDTNRFQQIIFHNVQGKQGAGAGPADIASDTNYRRSWKHLIDTIANEFVLAVDRPADERIETALGLVGGYANADRSYVFRYDSNADTMTNTHEWCGADIEPQIDKLKDIPCDWFPTWMLRFHAGELIRVPNVLALDPQRDREQLMLLSQGIKSVVAVPMMREGRLTGFVGFDAVKHQRGWNEDEADLLARTGELIASLLWGR